MLVFGDGKSVSFDSIRIKVLPNGQGCVGFLRNEVIVAYHTFTAGTEEVTIKGTIDNQKKGGDCIE